jgi:hypothetical protein
MRYTVQKSALIDASVPALVEEARARDSTVVASPCRNGSPRNAGQRQKIGRPEEESLGGGTRARGAVLTHCGEWTCWAGFGNGTGCGRECSARDCPRCHLCTRSIPSNLLDVISRAREVIPVDASIVAMAYCDAQHVGRVASPTTHVGAADGSGVPHGATNVPAGETHVGASTRATQSIPPALRRKVMRRDHERCVVPGCRHATFVDLHHVEARADGGMHDEENLTARNQRSRQPRPRLPPKRRPPLRGVGCASPRGPL